MIKNYCVYHAPMYVRSHDPYIRFHTEHVCIANELINQKTDRQRLVQEQAELMSFVWIRLRILLLPSSPVPIRAIVP